MATGPTHRVAAVAAWLGAAPFLPLDSWWQLPVGAIVAGASGNGRLSPDMDHPRFWTGRLFSGHRHETHVWAVPLVMFGVGLVMARSGSPHAWAVLAVAVAWASHIALDAPLGGVPLWFGHWRRVGPKLDTGGFTEHRLVMPVLTLTALVFGVVDLLAVAGVSIGWLA